ncbi:MAG: glycosyltransferase family 2 protein [Magnetococcales bacterium]|nr:glycosyltransferase family 2 protein [Magnetococcales bacterium]
MRTFVVLTPVFNDWPCLQQLVEDLNALPLNDACLHVLAINDGSTTLDTLDFQSLPPRGCVVKVETWNLICNLGNQKAISMGLAHLEKQEWDFEAVIVMDSDGEDSPESIPELIRLHGENSQDIWVCTRRNRTENMAFKVGYFFYRLLFSLLVGKVVNFGNYSLVPKNRLISLVSRPELWQHYPSAIIRSRIPYHSIPSKRGERYFGQSSQNLGNLLVHGLNGISVFGEIVYARIFFTLMGIIVAAMGGIGIVVFVRFGTEWSTPGWATDLVSSLLIILGMVVLFMLVMSLQFLNMNMNVHVIPKLHSDEYIGSGKVNFNRHNGLY